ncbi:respiratory chain complex I subunit 1 family protein [Microaerobacter geothermalis]|uniref:respiratory chain complex I subunit 1 family protein n=1 Tax=Microaerobacter geothermalis TaxID=674972 RepID=UPI001F473480|nr:respiratory chain complex I subunit 1 family protein [Microaerobacter geothermalis]MCF6093067.1 respiratory chain complex I subunit 1 family protein [Microaerobacter geothermalis]
MLETIIFVLLQLVLILFTAPLLQGIIKKTKALLQSRKGPMIFQPYYDLWKYMKKDLVISHHASWLTRATPYIVFSALITAGLLIPTFSNRVPLQFAGDFIAFVYLIGLARFFTALTALDAGSAFGGMGASREMALSAIAEIAFLLAVFSVTIPFQTTNLETVASGLASGGWEIITPSHILSLLAMILVVITETGRIPVDNPDTHLELTMIHEGMLLEYSGRQLGLMVWGSLIKQFLIISLLANLFFPWGMSGEGWSIFLSLILFLIKIFFLGILLAIIETSYAKIRLFQVPKLLGTSMVMSLLAILTQFIF